MLDIISLDIIRSHSNPIANQSLPSYYFIEIETCHLFWDRGSLGSSQAHLLASCSPLARLLFTSCSPLARLSLASCSPLAPLLLASRSPLARLSLASHLPLARLSLAFC